MEGMKLAASKATVAMLDSCVALFDKGPFDAINVPILLNALVDCDKSVLREYMEDQGAEQVDFNCYMATYMQERATTLFINKNDRFDGMTQEEAEKVMPSSHVPDDDIDEEDGGKKRHKHDYDDEDLLDDEYEDDEDGDDLCDEEDFDDELKDETKQDGEDQEKKPEKIPLSHVINEVVAKVNETKWILTGVRNKNISVMEVLDYDPRMPRPQEECDGKDAESKPVKKAKPRSIKACYRSEKSSDCILFDVKGKEHWYPSSDEFLKLIFEITDIAQEFNFTVIEPVHFTIALFRTDNEILKEMMGDFEINYKYAKKFFTDKSILKVGIIPFDLQNFLYCLNDKVDIKKPCEILMRDKEVETIWNICLKMTKRNAIIVGEAGVGKSALFEKITYDIASGKCPEKFKNYQVMVLDVNSLIAGTMYRGDAEARIKNLIDFLQNHNNIILCIDEVHTMLGAGSCKDGEMDLANAMKPLLARGETVVIGATTIEEYEKHFAQDKALSRRFEKVEVEEPSSEKVYPMIVNKIKALSEFHKVKISKRMVEYAIMISHCFNKDMRNPDRTLDTIDRSLVHASLNGKESVEKEDILATYGIYFEKFEHMNKEALTEVAYHEVGHYLFAKLSPHLTNIKLLAVSIMPAEDYLGVTCHEYRKDVVPHTNRAFYIDLLAYYLAGRVSEKIYTKDITDGARSDLHYATSRAHNMVSKYGLTADGAARNFVYLNEADNPMYSEKVVNDINKEVRDITQEAYKRAEEVINANLDLVKALVRAMVKKHIMSEPQLDKICQKYLKK